MARVMRMPAALAGVAEAAVQAWLAEPGQPVTAGAPLVEIETEKAIFEYEADVSGTIGALLVEPGASVAVGAPIAVILEPGDGPDVLEQLVAESMRMSPPAHDLGTSAEVRTDATAAPEPRPEAEPEPEASKRIIATPIVRRIARERGIDLASVEGSGPAGRIVRRDLDRVTDVRVGDPGAPDSARTGTTASVVSPAGWRDAPVSPMRRAIARRLTDSATSVPHFQIVVRCKVDALLALRRELNALTAEPVSVNDFVLKAVAHAMRAVPEMNAIWKGDAIREFDAVDIAMAVAVEGGLLTPVVRGVDRMPLAALAATTRDLAERARTRRLGQDELEGGTFTVSNLGMLGAEQFTAIINPPHSGILAVGAAAPAAVVEHGELVARTVMTVTLSADHRVVDGAVAARWAAAFTSAVESPLKLLI